MGKAVCNTSAAPLRREPNHRSEMVSQMLFGESADVLGTAGHFLKVRMDYDGYEGFVHYTQLSAITDEEFSSRPTAFFTDLFGYVPSGSGSVMISMGSEIASPHPAEVIPATHESIARTAILFLNTPYLWSGRSVFGIDCSGFMQIVFKIHGLLLPRDAHKQAGEGTVLDFIEESLPGDLAFFEDEEGNIVHVGMMLEDQRIIHAYGKVRIDLLDSSGIFNVDLNKHTHRLRFVRRLL
ncbi:C40 family peptidase [Chryseobacterium sp.]|uniref:C40 family peptidase n=1 Tax=Chryseobacterium sp. TaxID=1871047 RepID=UPI0012A7B0B4|nr:C40 family peptidase [Chryseobacterium sp.]QFG54034.1 NlpC/P60 family protein [Chryseobacterium sp.]